MTKGQKPTRAETIVIGGGQAGLVTGYYLAQRGIPFRILDANPRIGDAWRNRWDSLRLFSLARYSALPGMKFPGPGDAFPTKQQMADYLESYAERFKLPVESGVRVDRLTKRDGRFYLQAGDRKFEASQVIVAMANYQVPRIPRFARDLDPEIRQLHSTEYRNPSQLRDGDALVVGLGNSGADIAMEIAKTHRTYVAGTETGGFPFRIETPFWRFFGVRVFRFVGHHLLSLGTPVGRKLYPKLANGHAPLVRVKLSDLGAAGIERVARVEAAQDGQTVLAGGRVLQVANVIWCTGFTPGFSWIDLPVLDGRGVPIHQRGVVRDLPGLFFVGLHFQYAMSSATLIGVARDAEYVVDALERHRQRSAAAHRLDRLADRYEEHHGVALSGR
jgi:putative flavoprotein involved in K+ transport